MVLLWLTGGGRDEINDWKHVWNVIMILLTESGA